MGPKAWKWIFDEKKNNKKNSLAHRLLSLPFYPTNLAFDVQLNLFQAACGALMPAWGPHVNRLKGILAPRPLICAPATAEQSPRFPARLFITPTSQCCACLNKQGRGYEWML